MSLFALLMSLLFVALKIFVFGTILFIVLAFTLGPVLTGIFQAINRLRGRRPEAP